VHNTGALVGLEKKLSVRGAIKPGQFLAILCPFSCSVSNGPRRLTGDSAVAWTTTEYKE
jgi:hypothetical protein